MLHICSLAALPETVRATGASHILTVMANVDQVQRPASVLEANHLRVSMDDITEQMDGFVAPSDLHIEKVLNFVRGWDRSAPMVCTVMPASAARRRAPLPLPACSIRTATKSRSPGKFARAPRSLPPTG